MMRVMDRIVFDRSLGPTFPYGVSPLTLVPNQTVNELWLRLDSLSYAQTAKHQCAVAFNVVSFFCLLRLSFNGNAELAHEEHCVPQLRRLSRTSEGSLHWSHGGPQSAGLLGEIRRWLYKGSVLSKHSRHSRPSGSSAGLVRACLLSLMSCFHRLAKGVADDELDSDDLLPLLQSIRLIKAQYVHQPTEAKFLYDALRQGLSVSLHITVFQCQDLGWRQRRSNPLLLWSALSCFAWQSRR